MRNNFYISFNSKRPNQGMLWFCDIKNCDFVTSEQTSALHYERRKPGVLKKW